MAPSEHLHWLEDNIQWFEALPVDALQTPVPSCPGWNIEKVLTHLTYGLGLAYPAGVRAASDSSDDIFSRLPWPATLPKGMEAKAEFSRLLRDCLQFFRSTDPDTPCWTYAGAGLARFWFQRAAIETTIHRMDVHDALSMPELELSSEQVADAVDDAVTFVLPLAAQLSGSPADGLAVVVGNTGLRRQVGETTASSLVGDGSALVGALWGRPHAEVVIQGDEQIANAWSDLIGSAFGGR